MLRGYGFKVKGSRVQGITILRLRGLGVKVNGLKA